MPRKPKGLNKPIAKTAARMSRKAALTPAQLEKLDAYWRASNYLSACQLYLLDNPLLKQPLEPAHIKKKIVGHWGTVPGQNFIYTHLNRIINKYDLDMIYLSGPGHGGNAMVAQTYLEGSYSEIYPNISQDLEGMQKLFKQFSFPGGIPSHVAPETPGSIHEGGELGYSLSHAFGAVLDNPDLIAACVVGDGEAETGPLATAWHGNKFLNPIGDGAVLPILHLNGFKIHNPTILSRISHGELESFFRGCGWEPRFVEGDDPKTMHQTMAAALDWAIREIKRIQANARTTGDDSRPTWPMIVLRSPKGWTGPKEVDGATIEGSFRAHQVPIDMSQPHHLQLLESWLRSYKPEELFTDEGKLRPELQALAPKGDRRMGANPHANGGKLLRELKRPDFRAYGIDVPSPGSVEAQDMLVLGSFVRDVIRDNADAKNFRVFGPDESKSNRLTPMFETTSRVWNADLAEGDEYLGHSGRVMDSMLSHQDPGFLDHVANKKADVVRMYLPPDANCLLSCFNHCIASRNYVNVLVTSKHPRPQWLTMEQAVKHCTQGIGIWQWASNDQGQEPDVVLACCGDTPTLETLATVTILRHHFPDLKVRVINVVDLMRLQSNTQHPHGLSDSQYDMLFTQDKPILFTFHGYPSLIHELTYRRKNKNLHVRGYIEEGTITTPFDMRVLNNLDRFHLTMDVIHLLPEKLGTRGAFLIQQLQDKLVEHKQYIAEHGQDLPEIRDWKWNNGNGNYDA